MGGLRLLRKKDGRALMDGAGSRFAIFKEALEASLPRAGEACIPALAGSAAAFAAAALASPGRIVFAVSPGAPQAEALFSDLCAISAESGVRALEYPPHSPDDPAAAALRIRVAAALDAWATNPYPLVVALSIPSLDHPAPDVCGVAARTVSLKAGDAPDGGIAELARRLAEAGYERARDVSAPMQFAVRGGIVDVWPSGEETPVRAEFDGDEIESLRTFDPGTQSSTGAAGPVAVRPAAAGPVEGEAADIFSIAPAGSAAILWIDHNAYARPARARRAAAEIFSGDPAPRGVPVADFATAPLPGFAESRAEIARNPELVESVRVRLAAHLRAIGEKGARVFESPDLSAGFELPGIMAAVAESDRSLAKRAPAGRRTRASAAGRRIAGAADLSPGDLVVHLEHGIGRFAGSTEVESGGKREEVFEIEYAGGAKLYVPAAQAHVLSRYVGVKGEEVRLHALGGTRWAREKNAARKSVRDLAASLLAMQARRAIAGGFRYDTSPEGYAQFEAAFPYAETEDQTKAFADVLDDMASPRMMDRLVCGDAGYGKTEVAMRAACIAALNGRQTAVLVPTTVLAQQHFETFTARFEGLPVRVEVLSRIQSRTARAATLKRMAAGSADIVIGTHALLSRRVRFRNLGLVVVDEEQRFGVAHKEHLKRIRAQVDVLTLSATPIPRTLHMAMTGIRDLSLLRTPPQERVAVDVKIVRDNDADVKRAIENEMARGGQTFFLYNRVATMDMVRERLAALVPRARIATAHGRMDAREIAARMNEFASGGTDVLVCTTIVESGVDITRANTIIVDRADRFGLADLYQLRGRVGRGARRGHALFLLPPEGAIDSEARERMDALRRHSGLGAGFGIAMRDLEIRGAGNILGREQSGHIAAVGFELYCRLLRDTISSMKGEKVRGAEVASLNLDFIDPYPGRDDAPDAACLPYSYIEDEAHRMELHKRLAEASGAAEVRAVGREMADRFGPPPKAAARLVRVAELRAKCTASGIARVETRDGRAYFYGGESSIPVFAGRISGKSADSLLSSLSRLAGEAAAAVETRNGLART